MAIKHWALLSLQENRLRSQQDCIGKGHHAFQYLPLSSDMPSDAVCVCTLCLVWLIWRLLYLIKIFLILAWRISAGDWSSIHLPEKYDRSHLNFSVHVGICKSSHVKFRSRVKQCLWASVVRRQLAVGLNELWVCSQGRCTEGNWSRIEDLYCS